MRKFLFTLLIFTNAIKVSYSQACSYGTLSNETAMGENISTGGAFEYAGAVDFDIPFGIDFTVNQVTVNILKGQADLQYVNLAFLTETEGIPGEVIASHVNLVPGSQDFLYETGIQDFDVYQISIELPEALTFGKGKYFLSLAAAPGDEEGAWWEITDDYQTYGVFDYNKFEEEPWGGTGYYNKVFQVLGTCASSGETPPNYGNSCEQEVQPNNYEGGTPFISNGQLVTIADDFIVPENTIFYLTEFEMDALLLGGGMHNASINLRTSNGNLPGDVISTFIKKGPSFEKFGGYWPFMGSPIDVAAVKIGFTFEEPIILEEGTYFIEVIPTPYATDFITWESTSDSGIGNYSYSSFDGGATWALNTGINQVFKVKGYCAETLGTETPTSSSNLRYFPNPVTNVLNVSSKTPIHQISVYNTVGQKVAETKGETSSMDLEFLPAGIYVFKTEFEHGIIEFTTIIKK